MTDLRSIPCMACGCRWSRRFATAHSTSHRCDGWCGIMPALPIDGLILAATTGESLTLRPAKPNGWCSRCANEARRARSSLPICLGLSAAATQRPAGHAGENGGMADRWLLISCPYYSRPIAARPRTSLQRARRSRRAPGPALQHSLPDRRQSRQRGDAAACRLIQISSALKDCCDDRSQSTRSVAPAPGRFRRPDRRGCAISWKR